MTLNLTRKNIILILNENGQEYAAIPYTDGASVGTVSFTAANWELDTTDDLYKLTVGQFNSIVEVLNSSGQKMPLVNVVKNQGYITLESVTAFAGSVTYL